MNSSRSIHLLICSNNPFSTNGIAPPPSNANRFSEHRASVPKVVSSNLDGRKCCLCNFISKWLDFNQVFPDKDSKQEVPSHNPCSQTTLGRYRTHTPFAKSRPRSSRCCGLVFLSSKCGRLGVIFPKRPLALYEARYAKNSHKSKGDNAKC